jgi:hypothetical protein
MRRRHQISQMPLNLLAFGTSIAVAVKVVVLTGSQCWLSQDKPARTYITTDSSLKKRLGSSIFAFSYRMTFI